MKTINPRLLQFFSTLADETRLRIVLGLSEGPRNVNGIYEGVGKKTMTLSAISHALKQMTDLRIVVYEKRGREKVYRLSDEFCWCILRDAFKQFGNNIEIKCEKCGKR